MSSVPYAKFTNEKIVEGESAQDLPSPVAAAQPKKRWWTWKRILASSCLALAIHSHGLDYLLDRTASTEGLCPQVPALYPAKNAELFGNVTQLYDTDAYKQRAISWLSGAVRVPTESYDTLGPIGVDPRWEAFGPFHDYLLANFPLIHSTLELTKVNTYGLVYHWKGSNPSLKPVLLAAHQDVVPVHPDTVDEWVHPPYSGYWDGERIWGRGSSDDKGGLIGILASIETLLEQGFVPTRPVVLAFGFDEECSGNQGAGHLGPYLEEKFGRNGFAMVVDEGSGYQKQYGTVFATPGIGEKGYTDIKVQVSTPGGHSSIPPPHTGIGILASLLVRLEDNPILPRLVRDTPIYGTIQCYGAHAEDIPSRVKKAIARSLSSDWQLHKVQSYFFKHDKGAAYIAGTTQAIDIISGGVKANALPELAYATVNHRVCTDSSLAAIRERDTELLKDLAKQYNLSFTSFGEEISSASDAPFHGSLTLEEAFHRGLEPAPITPTKDAKPYALLSGTIKTTFNSYRNLTTEEGETEKGIKVAPGMMTGNTDTRYYWNLTEHIFRYNHKNAGDGSKVLSGVHTVNEFIEWNQWAEIIRFFTTLILNADENEL